VGDVRDGAGDIVAGARDADGRFADSARLLRERADDVVAARDVDPSTNTTLAVVVTDAPLDREALAALARMASTALSRRITPVNTPFDGDIVFALSVAAESAPLGPNRLLSIGVTAVHALENAIERAVTVGRR
jgi:L-aminopeptidase/D-esterase-like protein